MKPRFADCDRSPLLKVPPGLFPPPSVQLGELLFSSGVWVLLSPLPQVRVASTLLTLHEFISIFPMCSFCPSINEAPLKQYFKDPLMNVQAKCICTLSFQLPLYVAWI